MTTSGVGGEPKPADQALDDMVWDADEYYAQQKKKRHTSETRISRKLTQARRRCEGHLPDRDERQVNLYKTGAHTDLLDDFVFLGALHGSTPS